jgi:hypothetical protein
MIRYIASHEAGSWYALGQSFRVAKESKGDPPAVDAPDGARLTDNRLTSDGDVLVTGRQPGFYRLRYAARPDFAAVDLNTAAGDFTKLDFAVFISSVTGGAGKAEGREAARNFSNERSRIARRYGGPAVFSVADTYYGVDAGPKDKTGEDGELIVSEARPLGGLPAGGPPASGGHGCAPVAILADQARRSIFYINDLSRSKQSQEPLHCCARRQLLLILRGVAMVLSRRGDSASDRLPRIVIATTNAPLSLWLGALSPSSGPHISPIRPLWRRIATCAWRD